LTGEGVQVSFLCGGDDGRGAYVLGDDSAISAYCSNGVILACPDDLITLDGVPARVLGDGLHLSRVAFDKRDRIGFNIQGGGTLHRKGIVLVATDDEKS